MGTDSLNRARWVIGCALTAIGCAASLGCAPSIDPRTSPGSTSSASAAPRVQAPAEAPTIEIASIANGVWTHTSYYTYPSGTRFPSNGLIVRNGEGLLLVDTAWGEIQTLTLLDRIAETIDLPVRSAIVTHAHHDRAAGTDVLEARGIEVVAHPMTQRRTLAQGTAVPDVVLDGLENAGDHLAWHGVEIYYPGPAHAADNLMVWVPSARVLFGGCAVRPASSTSLGSTADADLEGWPAALRRARDRYPGAQVVVPGHGAAGDTTLLEHTLRVLAARETPTP